MMNRPMAVLASLMTAALAGPSYSAARPAQIVNCVVAVVNTQIITLTDVKLIEAFGLFDTDTAASSEDRRRFLLDKLIDQKIVIDIARERAPLDRAKLGEELSRLLAGLGREEAKRRLEAFGLDAADLMPYLEEKMLCQAIIANRFGRSVSVSLPEIENYYAETYVPAQKRSGLDPRPLIELLSVLEAEIKKVKVDRQVALWIKNLRQQAEIEVHLDCLKY